MKNRPLAAQFRSTFALILVASILATVVTYLPALHLFSQSMYRSFYPENYYEQQLPGLEDYVRAENTAMLSPAAEAGLQSKIHGDGIRYQVVDGEGGILYGTDGQTLFETKKQLFNSLNTTVHRQGGYTRVVPVIDGKGTIAGAVLFSYQLKISYANNSGRWVIAAVVVALFSPFLYMVIFTFLFSRRFAKNINRPLQLLTDAARKIKEKDLDFTIDYHAENELGRLCGAFSEMQEALREALSAQWKMEQDRVEMVEALAHDLKSPLSVIKAYTEALLDAPADGEKACRYLTVIRENTEKSASLVQEMQYTTDLEKPGVPLRLVPVNLAAFLKQKAHDYEVQAEQKGVQVLLKQQGDLSVPVWTDMEKLERILDNLVSNSLQYTPAGGRVGITVKAEPGRVSYEVCDSGSGFTPKDLEKAFDRFYRGDEARQSKDGHSGLGLYIVRQLVEQLGGGVRIENVKSGGARVLFWHPAAEKGGGGQA